MAAKKRAGLGRGLSALIPQAPPQDDRAIDVFFDGSAPSGRQEAPTTASNERSAGPATAVAVDVLEPETADQTINSAAAGAVDATSESIEPAENLLPVPGAQLGNLDPYRVLPNARQPRTEFDEEALEELITSVREFGVFQPIVVRPLAEDDPRTAEGDFELIMGERRLRATKAAGLESIPAIIRHTDDDDMLRDALLENLHRAELNPLEEAAAYRQLLDDFGCTQDELASRIGRSRPRISNTMRLLKLPVDVQRKVAAGILSAGHARAILSVGEPAAMTKLADKIINEQLSVRQAEAAAAMMNMHTEQPSSRSTQVGSDSLNAHLSEVGERLGDRLNTRVKVVLRKTKGQISIDFASVADLNRILEAIGESGESAESEDA